MTVVAATDYAKPVDTVIQARVGKLVHERDPATAATHIPALRLAGRTVTRSCIGSIAVNAQATAGDHIEELAGVIPPYVNPPPLIDGVARLSGADTVVVAIIETALAVRVLEGLDGISFG